MSDSVQPHRRQATRLPRPWDSPGKNTGVGCHFLLQCMKVKSESEVAQSCRTLCDPMDCSLPGSSVHGIFQARVLESGAIAFSNVSSMGSQRVGHDWVTFTFHFHSICHNCSRRHIRVSVCVCLETRGRKDLDCIWSHYIYSTQHMVNTQCILVKWKNTRRNECVSEFLCSDIEYRTWIQICKVTTYKLNKLASGQKSNY